MEEENPTDDSALVYNYKSFGTGARASECSWNKAKWVGLDFFMLQWHANAGWSSWTSRRLTRGTWISVVVTIRMYPQDSSPSPAIATDLANHKMGVSDGSTGAAVARGSMRNCSRYCNSSTFSVRSGDGTATTTNM